MILCTNLLPLDSTQNTLTMNKLQNQLKPYFYLERGLTVSLLVHLQTFFKF